MWLLISPAYNVSISQISVGGNVADLEFSAIFDSGTSFTYLNDPAYTLISESVSSLSCRILGSNVRIYCMTTDNLCYLAV